MNPGPEEHPPTRSAASLTAILDELSGAETQIELAGTAAPAAVAAVAAGSAGKAEAAPVDLSSDKMQDTEHTRAYLESTRF